MNQLLPDFPRHISRETGMRTPRYKNDTNSFHALKTIRMIFSSLVKRRRFQDQFHDFSSDFYPRTIQLVLEMSRFCHFKQIHCRVTEIFLERGVKKKKKEKKKKEISLKIFHLYRDTNNENSRQYRFKQL